MKLKLSIEKYIENFIEEILLQIDIKGKINIHINQVFISDYKDEDFVRQSFIFFTLCKVHFFLPKLVDKHCLNLIFKYIDINYKENKKLTSVDRKFIELYMVRGCIFWEKNTSRAEEFSVKENMSVIYTSPVLTHLFLETEANALTYLNKSLFQEVYIKFAKEAVVYALRSEQKDTSNAFYFSGILNYHDVLGMNIKNEVLGILSKKHHQELSEINITHTSVLAALFQDYSSIYPNFEGQADYFLSEVLSRNIKTNPYLRKRFNFTDNSLSEIKNTSYVCLDTYSHIILGMLNLLYKYDK